MYLCVRGCWFCLLLRFFNLILELFRQDKAVFKKNPLFFILLLLLMFMSKLSCVCSFFEHCLEVCPNWFVCILVRTLYTLLGSLYNFKYYFLSIYSIQVKYDIKSLWFCSSKYKSLRDKWCKEVNITIQNHWSLKPMFIFLPLRVNMVCLYIPLYRCPFHTM